MGYHPALDDPALRDIELAAHDPAAAPGWGHPEADVIGDIRRAMEDWENDQ